MVDEVEVTRLAREWRSTVERHESQAARVREWQPRYDRWGALAEVFSPGPATEDIRAVLGQVEAGETWMDVGCGAGRFVAHLATKAGRVLGVDSSPGMTEALRESAKDRGLDNVKVLPAAPWPIEEVGEPVDVVLSAHVLYFVTDVVPFVRGMEAHARRRCVVVLGDEAGSLPPFDAWYAVHQEPLSRLPAVAEFEELMAARGIALERVDVPVNRGADADEDADAVLSVLAEMCLLTQESPKLRRLREWFDEQQQAAGSMPPVQAMRNLAVLSWTPPAKE